MVWVVVPACDVRFQSKPWIERSVFKREPNIGRCCPRLNVAASEAAELIDEFEVLVPAGFPSPNPRADGVPEFMGRPVIKARVLPIQAEIVKVNISSR